MSKELNNSNVFLAGHPEGLYIAIAGGKAVGLALGSGVSYRYVHGRTTQVAVHNGLFLWLVSFSIVFQRFHWLVVLVSISSLSLVSQTLDDVGRVS